MPTLRRDRGVGVSTPKWIVLDASAINIPRILAAMQEGKPSVLSDHAAHEIERQLTHGPGVVVIDPEDDAAVIDLCGAYASVDHTVGTRSMRDALRSLLTTPKPPEPLGLGAVVEDVEGVKWLRMPPTVGPNPWCSWGGVVRSAGGRADRDYPRIDAVKVLSEGVVTP